MPENWQLNVFCPEMPTTPDSTALEPVKITITKPNGEALTFDGSIPATAVRGVFCWRTVDECQLTGEAPDGMGSLLVKLPEEQVRLKPLPGHSWWELWTWRMTALAIDADVLFETKDHRLGVGSIRFPNCPTKRVGWGQYLAAAVTATGSVTFGGNHCGRE